MTPFERFAVVRVPFPFSDRQASKRRPSPAGDGHLSQAIDMAFGLAYRKSHGGWP